MRFAFLRFPSDSHLAYPARNLTVAYSKLKEVQPRQSTLRSNKPKFNRKQNHEADISHHLQETQNLGDANERSITLANFLREKSDKIRQKLSSANIIQSCDHTCSFKVCIYNCSNKFSTRIRRICCTNFSYGHN